MESWHISVSEGLDRSLRGAVRALLRGELIVYPTETFYGLGALPFFPNALQRIYELKGRSPDKPLPLIAASAKAVRRVTRPWPDWAERLAAAFWPGPLSLILAATEDLPELLSAGTGTVAVRVSAHPIARRLATRVGGLLVSTSANRSGREACRCLEHLEPALRAGVAGVVAGGTLPGGLPSTLVGAAADGRVRLLRRGAVPLAVLEGALGERIEG